MEEKVTGRFLLRIKYHFTTNSMSNDLFTAIYYVSVAEEYHSFSYIKCVTILFPLFGHGSFYSLHRHDTNNSFLSNSET